MGISIQNDETLTNFFNILADIIDKFNTKSVVDINFFEQQQKVVFSEQYLESLPKKDKLRNYALFKFSFETEPYVQKYLARNKRSLFAQLRCGILPLRIETGRYNQTLLNDRICEYCTSGLVEEEYHFIFSCNLYSPMREHLLDKCEELHPNFSHLEEVEKSRFVLNNEFIQLHTANYVSEAYFLRKEIS